MAFGKHALLLIASYLFALTVLFGPAVADILGTEARLGELPVKPKLSKQERVAYVRSIILGTVTVRVHPYDGVRGMLQGNGTGAIISDEGHILTAAHVVRGSEFVYVTFHSLDGMATGFHGLRQEPADVLAVSPERDMAIIKLRHPARVRLTTFAVAADGFPPPQARFWFVGTSSVVQSGVIVATDQTVPLGDVNAPNAPPTVVRNATVARTTATQGDSGGPVCDANGTVVGILIGSDNAGIGVISPLRYGFTQLLAQAKEKERTLPR